MAVVFAGLTPHPPIIIPEVGGEEREKARATIEAMEKWAQSLLEAKPEVLILITPHGSVFQDAVAVTGDRVLEGSLRAFRAPQIKFSLPNHTELADRLHHEARVAGLPTVILDRDGARVFGADTSLDHGLMVPLYFLQKAGLDIPVVVVAMGLLAYEELYALGMAIGRAIEGLGLRGAVVASGDLSHRLHPGAPAGYNPRGQEFDLALADKIRDWDVEGLLHLSPDLIEKAGECGLRPLIMACGALDGQEVQPHIFSYEGPYGVGYMVAAFRPLGPHPQGSLYGRLQQARQEEIARRRREESPLVALARQSLEYYVNKGKILTSFPPLPQGLPAQAGVFVSIKEHGQLRGCIGTTAPTRKSLAEEIVYNAVSAGTQDPRFSPVDEDELEDLVYSVDVLETPEKIQGLADLDPARYGVIVCKGSRAGLLLPNLEGIDTAEEQVAIAKQKAGISPGETVDLERFRVTRYF